jgi:hypothetical protein
VWQPTNASAMQLLPTGRSRLQRHARVQVLRKAQLSGVQVLAYDVDWREGTAIWGKRLPVVFDPSVSGEVDEEHLQRVLHFNATDPRSRWRSGGPGKEGGVNGSAAKKGKLATGAAGQGKAAKRKSSTRKAGDQ